MEAFGYKTYGIGITGFTYEQLTPISSLLDLLEKKYSEAQICLYMFHQERSVISADDDHGNIKSTKIAIHARSFIYALDAFERSLNRLPGVLPMDDQRRASIKAVHAHFGKRLPYLRSIRDSAHHPEDRFLRQARGRDVQPQPFHTNCMRGEGGVWVMESLNSDNYGCMTETGDFREIPVTADTVLIVKDALLSTLAVFDWKGPSSLEASRYR